METLQRLWNVLFGSWFSVKSQSVEFSGERMMGNHLLISATDEHYQIQLRLTADQADALHAWLGKTRGALNTTGKNKVIRLTQVHRSTNR